MIPLVDMHCHLLGGLDDGPRTEEDAVAMCRIAYAEGVRLAAATAHQNDRWPEVTPERIRDACQRLAQKLRENDIAIDVFPCAEIMVQLDCEEAWERQAYLTVGDRGKYVLVEMPHDIFVDITALATWFGERGIRPILAHPERHPELLHDAGRVEALIECGCLIQVSTSSVTDARKPEDHRALKNWFRRGIVHVVGSDAHSVNNRPPRMAKAYEKVAEWCGTPLADRVFSTNGMAVAYGLPLQVHRPRPRRKSWLPKLW